MAIPEMYFSLLIVQIRKRLRGQMEMAAICVTAKALSRGDKKTRVYDCIVYFEII